MNGLPKQDTGRFRQVITKSGLGDETGKCPGKRSVEYQMTPTTPKMIPDRPSFDHSSLYI
jgi:hypothetical protein